MSNPNRVDRRLSGASSRRGVVTLEYVMVIAVAFPVSYVLLRLAIRGFAAIYYFMSIALGGLNL